MSFLLQPWHILLAVFCAMVRHRQQQIIELQNAQIEALLNLTTIVTPDTILCWHRELVAKKLNSTRKRKPGRPLIRQEVVDAIVRFATENPTWDYDRIRGSLKNFGTTSLIRLQPTY